MGVIVAPQEHGKRWPASIYGSGEDPDPRFTLANERTFLAWIRTSLAFLAAGAAVEVLDLAMPSALQSACAVVLCLLGLGAALRAWFAWSSAERAMRHDSTLPGNGFNIIFVVGLVLLLTIVLVIPLID